MKNGLRTYSEIVRNSIQKKLQRTRLLMDAVHPECLVRGYERRIPSISLPDPDDRHIVAEAIHAKASTVVTFNLADFPVAALEQFRLSAVHPDEFLIDLFHDKRDAFLLSVNTHRTSLQKPEQSVAEYLESLRICGLPNLSKLLAESAYQC